MLFILLQEMIEALREAVVHVLHTRDGARVAMQCIWHGTAKVGHMLSIYL